MTASTPAAAARVEVDVSTLPESTFGHRDLSWWATASFMAVEGTTLAVLATSYLYLRMNAAEWPPRPASAPELLVPTLTLLALLVAMFPMWRAAQAARRFDTAGVRRWMVAGVLVTLLCTVLRALDFAALNVRWDTNAYGSVLWAVLVAHTLLLVTDLLEGATIAAIFFTDRIEPKHYSDVTDAALYQYFLSLSWVVLYALVILGPRVL